MPRLEYVHEPQAGISYARNQLIETAIGLNADAIVFLDDDELPDTDWLAHLLEAQRRFNAHIVIGSVLPSYDANVPEWVVRGRFFVREIPRTGTELYTANSGNALIVRSVFDLVGKFDHRFGLSGGEDTHFFWRASRAGVRIVTCRESVVRETVPVSRGGARWLMRRAYRSQNAYVRCERDLLPVASWMPRRTATTLITLVLGLARSVCGVMSGRAAMVRGGQDLLRALGAMSGMIGWSAAEYRIVHTRGGHEGNGAL